jgi:hypothetical protein
MAPAEAMELADRPAVHVKYDACAAGQVCGGASPDTRSRSSGERRGTGV